MHPGIVANRNLNHSESSLFEFLGHLNTDNSAPGFQRNRLENVTAEKAEVAVDVSDGNPECPPHRSTVDLADPDAIPGVRPFHFVAIHEIDVGCEPGQEV